MYHVDVKSLRTRILSSLFRISTWVRVPPPHPVCWGLGKAMSFVFQGSYRLAFFLIFVFVSQEKRRYCFNGKTEDQERLRVAFLF